jgi:hypothetical protein
MTTSRKRTAAGIRQAVASGDGAKSSYLILGDGPAVTVIPSGDSPDCQE